MKKILTIFVVIAFTTSLNAQWFKKVKGNGNLITKVRNVSEYDKITVSGSFNVKLVVGVEGELTITAEDNLLEYIVTEVEGGKLKIRWKKNISIRTRKKIVITVPFKEIEAVALSGSGDISSEDIIETDTFKIAIAGSGNMKLIVKTVELSSAISGSGNINISGSTNKLKCTISGSGYLDAYKLTSNEADARLSGSGGIKINVTKILKARTTGSGNVYYKGNPKKQDVKVSGSGSVRSL